VSKTRSSVVSIFLLHHDAWQVYRLGSGCALSGSCADSGCKLLLLLIPSSTQHGNLPRFSPDQDLLEVWFPTAGLDTQLSVTPCPPCMLSMLSQVAREGLHSTRPYPALSGTPVPAAAASTTPPLLKCYTLPTLHLVRQ
jgi:hypothetical protein